MACGGLTSNFSLDCSNPNVGGLDSDLILFNFSDWEDATVTTKAGFPLAITGITLGTGKNAYRIQGPRNVLASSLESSIDGGLTRYTHAVDFQIAGNDEDALELLRRLGLGTYVAVVFTRSKQIFVLGAGNGLVFQGQALYGSKEANGNFTVRLASDAESSLETKPMSLFVGTSSPFVFNTEKAVIEALVAP